MDWVHYLPAGFLLLKSAPTFNVQDRHYHPNALRTLLTDFDHISTIDAFFPIGDTADAGDILNPYIPLNNRTSTQFQETWWNTLPEEEYKRIHKSDLNTLDVAAYPEDNLLQLLLFSDHWNLASSGPFQEMVSTAPTTPIEEMPYPMISPLLALAKIRLVKGLKDGNVLEALKEVRHLARLMQGTEHAAFSVGGVKLLNLERETYELAVQNQSLAPDAWIPISSKDTKTARNLVLFGYRLYLSYDEGDAIKQFYALGTRRFNECGMLAMAGEWLLYRHRMNPDVAIEFDLFPMLADFEQAWQQSNCTLDTLKLFWDDPQYSVQHLTDAEKEMMDSPTIQTTILSSVMKDCSCTPDASKTSPY